jgi:tRNA (guanine-N7-)-methyltransferase
MPRLRVRKHVNPLSVKYMEPRAEAVRRPDHLGPAARVDVELGCADGQFSFELARANPACFVVGLDIREKMIVRNRERVQQEGLTNLVFAYVNLNVDQDRVLAADSVDCFHLLFPDPWFKAKHAKRRVMEAGLLHTLCDQLRDHGEIHVATDVFEIGLQAMAELEAQGAQELGLRNLAADGPWSFWRGNPFGGTSLREVKTIGRGQRVWRLRYGLTAGR